MQKQLIKRKFTLIELIIVIVVIGLLAGMSLPKFIGVQRDANVAKMFRDIDTLEKSISMFYLKEEGIPKKEAVDVETLPNSLKDILQETGELYENIYVIDKDALKGELQTLGFKKDTYIVTSSLNVYNLEGKKNGDGLIYHTYDYHSNLYKNIYIDNQKVKENSIIKVSKNKPMLRGILNTDEVNFYLNNENITEDIEMEEKENAYEFSYPISLSDNETKNLKIEDRNTKECLSFKVQNSKEVNFSINEWGLIDASDYNNIQMKTEITNKKSNINFSEITNEQLEKITNNDLDDGIWIDSLTLNGNVENEALKVTISGSSMKILDENGQYISFIDLNKGEKVQSISSGSNGNKRTFCILLPKNACKIAFERNNGPGYLINEIEILNNNTNNQIKNISISNKNYKQQLNWENSNNILRTLIFYDDKYVGFTTTNSFDYIMPNNNVGKKFKLIPINNENRLNEIYEFDSITPKVTFTSNYIDKEIEKNIFSKNESTSVEVEKVYWDQNLVGKTISVKLVGYSLSLKDANDKIIPFINAETGEEVTSVSTGSYSRTYTFKIIIPENAKYLYFNKNEGGYGVNDIHVVEEDKTNELKKIESWMVDNKAYITWEGSSKNVSIYYDNQYVGKSSNNSFEYTISSDNLGKEFKLIPINENNISSNIYTFTSNMPDCVFSTDLTNKRIESLLFDNDDKTITGVNSLTWDSDLTNRKLRIVLQGYCMYIYDENNKILNFTNVTTGQTVNTINAGSYGNTYDAKFIIPKNAKKIVFYRNEGGYGIKTIQLID